ncbi:hypothetical protein C8Q79DRAFT_940797 [Trametes meyenii]|nr:hypothetical protein C8Q79DRAFT_940797 [Trametes meyenii]
MAVLFQYQYRSLWLSSVRSKPGWRSLVFLGPASSLITGPFPSATPKGYMGKARFEHHETQPVHVAHALKIPRIQSNVIEQQPKTTALKEDAQEFARSLFIWRRNASAGVMSICP